MKNHPPELASAGSRKVRKPPSGGRPAKRVSGGRGRPRSVGSARLYTADTLSLRRLPEADVIITDPPYCIDPDNVRATKGKAKRELGYPVFSIREVQLTAS